MMTSSEMAQCRSRPRNAIRLIWSCLVVVRDQANTGFPFEEFPTQAQEEVHQACVARLDAALDLSRATMQSLFACDMSLDAEGGACHFAGGCSCVAGEYEFERRCVVFHIVRVAFRRLSVVAFDGV